MELKVKTPTFPEIIEFNFDELKQEITAKASEYMNLVYTEDQMQDAKKDRATLNKFVKALSDERIKIKKECLKPYEDFEVKIKELDEIVGRAIQNIDGQVKNYEELQRNAKRVAIGCFFEGCNPFEWLTLDKIFSEKWLNASVKMAAIENEITLAVECIGKNLDTLRNLPEFAFEAEEIYKDTLDLNKAISEGKRLTDIQKRKAEAEAVKSTVIPTVSDVEKVDTVEQSEKQWLSFRALLSVEDATILKALFTDRNIKFEAI